MKRKNAAAYARPSGLRMAAKYNIPSSREAAAGR